MRDGIQAAEFVHPFPQFVRFLPERLFHPDSFGHVEGHPGNTDDLLLRAPKRFERQITDTPLTCDGERHRITHDLSRLKNPSLERDETLGLPGKDIFVTQTYDGRVCRPQLLVI
jgi:hypothetical protein